MSPSLPASQRPSTLTELRRRDARSAVTIGLVALLCGGSACSDRDPSDSPDTATDVAGDSVSDPPLDVADAVDSDAVDGIADGSSDPGRVVELVDPFIGTGGIYVTVPNCFPGAVLPFGMISPSPDTTSPSGTVWFSHASGYHYDDSLLMGFSHNRLQGVSTPDLGALLLLPWLGGDAEALVEPEARRPEFSHDDEIASPGYYSVAYDAGRVRAELTATERTAHHRYSFDGDGERHVVVDLFHAPERTTVEDAVLDVSDDRTLLTGWIATRGRFSGHASDFRTYFALRLSRAPDAILSVDRGAVLTWDAGATVEAQVAISYVDVDGALGNLQAEAPEFDFDGTRERAEGAWEQMLSRVRFEGGSDDERTIMATSLYHTMVMPTRMTDGDGRFRGIDGAVHDDPGFRYFSNFSMWDTYRTVHPLYALAWPEYQLDMARSLMLMADHGGYLPRWPMTWTYTGGTIGAPADIVLADTWLRGVIGFDADGALARMVRLADAPTEEGHPFSGRPIVETYREIGYVPGDVLGLSVSTTLELSIADGAIAELADALGEEEIAADFRQRAANYRNLWDPELRVFRSRAADGSFVEPFDRNVYESASAFYGGNGVQHTWLVPHDLPGLVTLFDDPEQAIADLEALFEGERADRELLGPLAGVSPPRWYYHGNEPDLHAAWVFDVLGRPDLAQEWSDWVAGEFYTVEPGGLAGNEDMGALSAWYVWSALGIYPLTPSDVYLVGRPAFPRMEVEVAGGTLVIEAPGAGDKTYVAGLDLDGVPLDRPWLHHGELVGGATLRFELSEEPTSWGSEPSEAFPVRLGAAE